MISGSDDFDYEKLTRALEGALPPAAVIAFVESVRRMTPERRRSIGRIMRGKARWNDWLGDGSLSEGGKFGAGYFPDISDLIPPLMTGAYRDLEIVTKHPPCEYLAPPPINGPIVSFEVDGVMMTAVEDPSYGTIPGTSETFKAAHDALTRAVPREPRK